MKLWTSSVGEAANARLRHADNGGMLTRTTMLQLSRQEHDSTRVFADALRDRFGDRVRGIHLFGSKARGEGTAESDVDLLVVLGRVGEWEQRDVIRLASTVLRWHGPGLQRRPMCPVIG